MKSIKHKALEARLLKETGQKVRAEDHSYRIHI